VQRAADATLVAEVAAADPDLVICPFLRERVPIGEALIAAAAMACSSRVFRRGLGGGP
jgi:hypothetical protein